MASEDEPWGQLLSVTESESPILLGKETITVGRNSTCDISFVTNHLISSNHCLIMQDKDGQTWLTDTSMNGTVVNGKHVKGQKVKINHNDMIQLVRWKNQPDKDVSYIFQDLKLLKQESAILDGTLEYDVEDLDTSAEAELNTAEVPAEKEKEKRKLELETEIAASEVPAKRPIIQDFELEPEQIKADQITKSSDKISEPLTCGICQDIFHDCLSLQPCMHSFCSSCYSQWMEKSNECPICRGPVQRMSKNHLINNLVEAYLVENPEKRRPVEEIAEMDAKNKITNAMTEPRPPVQNTVESEDSDSSDDSEYRSRVNLRHEQRNIQNL